VVAVPVVAACVAAGGVLLVSGDDGSGGGAEAPAGDVPVQFQDKESAGGGGGAAAGKDAGKAVTRAVRDYIKGIDERDGARVCAVLAPGAIESFQLPRVRGGCAPSLSASIGYRDPRGYPVFATARLDSIRDVAIGAADARVTATVVTRFADRDQPSIEDDLIYLVETGGGWRIAKPSSTLYRAVGKPQAPPQVLAPPG